MVALRWIALIPLALTGAAPAWAQDADGDGVPNASDAYPCDATASATAFAPAEGVFGSIVFEDLWPARGDLDFNDVVVGYNYVFRLDAQGRVVALDLAIDPMALGGNDDSGLGLHLPVARGLVSTLTRTIGSGAPQVLTPSADDAELTVTLSSNLRELFDDVTGPINSRTVEARRQGRLLLIQLVFSTPAAMSIGGAPFDVFIFHSGDARHEIHLPTHAGTARMNTGLFGSVEDGSSGARHFVDTAGLPFALVFPGVVEYPAETIGIAQLYPRIVEFAASGGAQSQDFYARDVTPQWAYRDVDGQAAPRLSVPARGSNAGLVSCQAVAVISGSVVGSQGSGNSLLLLRDTGEAFDSYGTGADVQAIQSLYDDLDQYGVIIIPDHQGNDSAMVAVMSTATNRARLVDWVRRGGVLYLGVYNDGGATTAIFNPAGFAISGADDRTDQPILSDRAFLHSPHELADHLRFTDSWERLSAFPSEATQTSIILGNNTAADFHMGNGYVLFQGAPINTRYGASWPGMHEVYGDGVAYYRNVVRYLRAQAGLDL